MIRFDGYYAFKPILYQERIELSPDYLNMGLLFKKNGDVINTVKWSQSKEMIFFKKNNFEAVNFYGKFNVNKDELYILSYKGEPWEEKFYYDIVSEKRLINRQTGELLEFIPWDNNKE